MAEKKHTKHGPGFKDLTGKTFGRLLIIRFSHKDKHTKSVWLCWCDCGKFCRAAGGSLVSGHTSSCGCLHREQLMRRSTRHGKCGTLIYGIWLDMRKRCTNPNSTVFRYYGGRGIRVCDRWLHSFENFYADMGDPPSPKHSIDRIDNDGDYCPENCRWATRKEQMCNTRRNRLITFRGKTQCLTAWAEEVGVDRRVLHRRLISGWSVARALAT